MQLLRDNLVSPGRIGLAIWSYADFTVDSLDLFRGGGPRCGSGRSPSGRGAEGGAVCGGAQGRVSGVIDVLSRS